MTTLQLAVQSTYKSQLQQGKVNCFWTLSAVSLSKHKVNVNVNVEVYSLKSLWVQQTLQFTPLVLELSLIRSYFLCREFSAFSAANVIHTFSNFHSTRYPITAEWRDAVWYERFLPTSTHELTSYTTKGRFWSVASISTLWGNHK